MCLDAGLYGLLIVAATLFVEALVVGLHLYIECLLHTVRQLFQHVLFQAAQHEGEDLAAQGLGGLLVGTMLDGVGILAVEVVERAQHGGVEEAVERVQLRQVVFYRRAAECQPVLAAEQQHGLSNLCVQVLDVLALIEDDVVELLFAELFYVVAHQGVGGQDEVLLHGLLQVALVAVVGVVGQLWCKLPKLVLPVKEQRAGHDDEGWLLNLRVDTYQHRNRL